MRLALLMVVFFLISSCADIDQKVSNDFQNKKTLTLEESNRLIQLPLDCIHKEYPNKLGQVLGDSEDLKSPKELHPAFYGCFDWHSSVHGHWSLVKLIKTHPEIGPKDEAIHSLKMSLTKSNILAEVEYFNGKHNASFERTYGWAWILKLAEELHSWDDPLAREFESNLQPLTDLIVEKYIEFLPKLLYPIRVGEHTNTAFGLNFALDYGRTVGHDQLVKAIKDRALEFYSNDKNCPIEWEPSGFDFLSPCLEEAALMSKVLEPIEFKPWINKFFPQLVKSNFDIEVGRVADRNDGKLVHLDGVNFSRAWCMYIIANSDKEFQHLIPIANKHIENSLPSLVGDSYEGGHWLGSFAIYSLSQ